MEHNHAVNLKMELAKADICELLAISLRNPDIHLIEGLLDGSLLQDANNLLLEIGVEAHEVQEISEELERYLVDKKEASALLSTLRQQYTRLFSDPRKPAVDIYETTFRYNQGGQGDVRPSLFISEAALDAERQYKAAGLALTASVREPADHLATEFEFMMYLHTQKAVAIQQHNEEQQSIRERQIVEFRETHFNKWLADFADNVEQESSHGFYKWLAAFMKACMQKFR